MITEEIKIYLEKMQMKNTKIRKLMGTQQKQFYEGEFYIQSYLTQQAISQINNLILHLTSYMEGPPQWLSGYKVGQEDP